MPIEPFSEPSMAKVPKPVEAPSKWMLPVMTAPPLPAGAVAGAFANVSIQGVTAELHQSYGPVL